MILVWIAILAALLLAGNALRVSDDKTHRLTVVGLFITVLVCLMGFTVSNYDFIPKPKNTPQTPTVEQTDTTTGSAISIDSDELEKTLKHEADIDVDDAVVKVGDITTGIGYNMDSFFAINEAKELSLYTRNELAVGNMEAKGSENFYIVKDSPQDFHLYAYAVNTEDYTIPIGYMTIGEFWIDMQRLSDAEVFGFNNKTTYAEVCEKFGELEVVDEDDVQHLWSTVWGHINMTFTESGLIETVDVMMHDDLINTLRLSLKEGGKEALLEEVEANEKAYQDRIKANASTSDVEP